MGSDSKDMMFSGNESQLSQMVIEVPNQNYKGKDNAPHQGNDDDGIDFEKDLMDLNNQDDNFKPEYDEDGFFRASTTQPNALQGSGSTAAQTYLDDRAIKGNASGKYTMPDGFIEDYEFVDDMQDGELAETDASLMNHVMQNYD